MMYAIESDVDLIHREDVAAPRVLEDSVARIWKDHGLKPWKLDIFKCGTSCRSSGECRSTSSRRC
jgi:hypothetical protein